MRKWIQRLSLLDQDCVRQYEYLLGRQLTGCAEYRAIDAQVEEMILDYETRTEFFSDYPELGRYRGDQDFIAGDRVAISGSCSEFWINDYNVRLNTEGTVWHTPAPYDKKVMVRIDCIGQQKNVLGLLRRSKLRKINSTATK